ncbi:MAG: FIST signal transduction protein [Planctomycetota bacterium]
MKSTTISWSHESGWSEKPFPALDSERTLVIVFGGARFRTEDAPIQDLFRAYPRSQIVGCSTAGEIHGPALLDDSLTVAVTRFDHVDCAAAMARVSCAEGSFAAGQELAQILTRDDLRAILILSDGLNVNGSELLRGLNRDLPDSVVVTGGLAADGDRFQRTWVLDRSGLNPGRVCAVGLYGDRLRVGHGSRGGWDMFGPERVVTRSKGNVLYELDGQPALELYKRYLGDRASGLPATALLFPLALRADREDKKTLVRTVLAVEETTQSMTFAGDVPAGHLAQLMRANFERLIDGASQAALHAREGSLPANDSTVLSIAISCVGRRLVLGERTEEEIEAALRELPEGTKQVGFYSYGEISPYSSGHCDLHNQTMTLTTLSED